MEESGYLVRFGLMRHVGLFLADSAAYGRGQEVVVRTHRGTELGEVLVGRPGAAGATTAPILRPAAPDDLARARRLAEGRPDQLAACEQALRGGDWPLVVLDVEPLLDGDRTVLHYLGPHRLDASGLIAAFRARCGLDVVLEPAGRDVEEPAPAPAPAGPEAEAKDHGCESCGPSGGGGCGSVGCGSGGCSTDSGGCAVKAIVASRKGAVDRK